MINQIYQLIKPKFINVKYNEENLNDKDKIVIRPNYMALCHADQRYYQGKRDPKILAKKLPMALIHECVGIVISDPTGTYKVGQKVVMIPNQPPRASDEEFYENYMSGTHFLSSGYAINDIIKYIKPQGSLVLMGVSEYNVNINTRDVLEKGLTLLGSSRSGRVDFEKAVEMLSNKKFERRFKNIIYLETPVKNINDIHRVFATDLNTAFKTVFKWEI